MMGTMASGILGELDRLQAESGREKVRDVIVVTLVSDCFLHARYPLWSARALLLRINGQLGSRPLL